MKYLIDHSSKTIHQREYAGEQCGFSDTPIDKREFIDSDFYIDLLETEKGYGRCTHCKSIQILTD